MNHQQEIDEAIKANPAYAVVSSLRAENESLRKEAFEMVEKIGRLAVDKCRLEIALEDSLKMTDSLISVLQAAKKDLEQKLTTFRWSKN